MIRLTLSHRTVDVHENGIVTTQMNVITRNSVNQSVVAFAEEGG